MMLKKVVLTSCLILGLSISHAQAQNVFPSFADLVEKLMPAVVNISTTHNALAEEETENHIETTVDSIFNAPITNKVSLGSGFIIDNNGFIVTNNHVIDKAQSITVTLANNKSYEAKLIGKDTKTDIALIKIEVKQPLSPVKFGDSDKIRVGDWILAIGNPFGLGGSVTAGIVSAKSRDIETGPYDNFIQTDASINQGSSGGPMFNMQGGLIGVNTAIFSTNGGSMGVGFAIPVNSIQFVINQLKKSGIVERGWIGIKMQALDDEMLQSLNADILHGAIITEVAEGSSAAKAGIKAGDIIYKFNHHMMDNTQNFSRMVAETPIGTIVEIEILHNNKPQILNIKIEKMPEEVSEQKSTSAAIDLPQAVMENSATTIEDLGLAISSITAQLADKYKLLPTEKGVIITQVLANGDAAQKGLKPGDIIISIDKSPVIDVADVQTHVIEAKRAHNKPLLLQIKSGAQIYFVAVKLNEEKGHVAR